MKQMEQGAPLAELQTKLAQSRAVVEAARRLMTNLHTGKVEGMLTDELYAALAALDAGKEAGG